LRRVEFTVYGESVFIPCVLTEFGVKTMVSASLLDFALSCKDVLRPFGETETLLFYACVAPSAARFTREKEIAAKNWIPKGPMPFLIKRGSKEPPLTAAQLGEAVTKEFLETRSKIEHLKDARGKITKQQETVWNYFLPRKLADFFYACNGETPGRSLDRVFFDLDRGKSMSVSQAQEAAREFVDEINDDADFWKSVVGKNVKEKPFVAWTGSSFHVYLLFKAPQPAKIYDSTFQYSKAAPEQNFTGKWVAALRKRVSFKIAGGHEKLADAIIVDPSQTPSGKLARMPLGSLHMKDAKTVDGVSMPLDVKRLSEKNLEKELRALTPRGVLEDLTSLSRLLPSF
jgi:hypothetical protein